MPDEGYVKYYFPPAGAFYDFIRHFQLTKKTPASNKDTGEGCHNQFLS